MGTEFRVKKDRYPKKRTMNLFYKPDRTTKPATVALYVLFALVCLLGLSKILIYDVLMETIQAQRTLAVEQENLSSVMLELIDYNEVRERYIRYAATDEERALVDRMEVLALLDEVMGATASVESISINGSTVQLQLSSITLAEAAQFVDRLEESPIVAGVTVNTASTAQEEAPVYATMLIELQKEVEEE